LRQFNPLLLHKTNANDETLRIYNNWSFFGATISKLKLMTYFHSLSEIIVQENRIQIPFSQAKPENNDHRRTKLQLETQPARSPSWDNWHSCWVRCPSCEESRKCKPDIEFGGGFLWANFDAFETELKLTDHHRTGTITLMNIPCLVENRSRESIERSSPRFWPKMPTPDNHWSQNFRRTYVKLQTPLFFKKKRRGFGMKGINFARFHLPVGNYKSKIWHCS